MSIKIFITDDHPLVLNGLQTILRENEDVEVLATFSSGRDLMEGLQLQQPDVLLTDLQLPGRLSGIELIKTLRKSWPDLPILVLSGQEAIFNVQDIMAQGCKGYLLKHTTDQDMLVQAIKEVYAGGLFLEPSLKNEFLRRVLKANKETEQITRMISQRQIEIIKLLAVGYSSQEIADKLYLSVRTIDSHRHRIMQKLDVKNVAGLLKKAAELNLL